MNIGFYPKLAFDGIRKNKRMYLPYILTCIGMVMMHNLLAFLANCPALSRLPGSEMLYTVLGFGSWVIAIFACIFLFYTNSFLIGRRKKEFGLYNILGMGKHNIGWILFWETLIVAALSLSVGLAASIALSKLAELGLVNIMQAEVTYRFFLSTRSIATTAAVFCVIFALLFFNSLRQVKCSTAIHLLRSANMGEKPPKGNWFFGLLGVLILGGAYFLAVRIEDPITALAAFFVAVVMVIIGTYLIMISGSVLFCRLLQRNKRYYYQPNHFVSVSSMVFRMKRNGAGLATLCILATMVLVMISSTASLYFGNEDALKSRYPQDINIEFYMDHIDELSDGNVARIRGAIDTLAQSSGVHPADGHSYRYAAIAGLLSDGVVQTDVEALSDFSLISYSNVVQFYFVPLADYNALMGTAESLEDGEAIAYSYRTSDPGQTITFADAGSFRIKKTVDRFVGNGTAAMRITPTMVLFVPDLEQAVAKLGTLADYNGDRMLSLHWVYQFDTDLDAQAEIALSHQIRELFRGPEAADTYQFSSAAIESREANRENFFSLYGGLFYLGIALSIVFIFAAVLIIYYKQISEGYEDQSRFEIMQKVGMTRRDIRRSINSQLLTVFFLPLIGAGLHIAFAFPMIRKLLLMFNLDNVGLFALTTAICFVIFALFYTLVYRITSNAYYHIVSGARES